MLLVFIFILFYFMFLYNYEFIIYYHIYLYFLLTLLSAYYLLSSIRNIFIINISSFVFTPFILFIFFFWSVFFIISFCRFTDLSLIFFLISIFNCN